MAPSAISTGLGKLQETLNGSIEGRKIADLHKNMKDYNVPKNRLTTDYGVKQENTDDWLKIVTEDKTGPMLLEDHAGREKINRFDHERIPERVVHARGAGAFGTFKMHKSLAEYTTAGVLTDTSRSTPLFVRFSTVLGSRDLRTLCETSEASRSKCTLRRNIPVFLIQDAIKSPDVIHAGKPEPPTEVPQAQSAHNNFWDLQYLHTEATHMFMWQQSDRAIPRSYRMMQGFGVNTFTLTNDKGERFFVKFHFVPQLGVHSLVWDEALKLAGQDPDFHRVDLYEALDNECFPKWDFGVQLIKEGEENEFEFDILDATKIWPEELVPVQFVGELELNRNIDEYFTQTEQVAFCTGHVVPGIGFSDDPLLIGRNFSYQDTQLTRLGTNWQEPPINRPVRPVMNNNRDGIGRHTITKGTVNYWPNRFEACPPAKKEEGAYIDYPEKVSGMRQRLQSKKFREHFNQAQLFYNSMSPHEKAHIAFALSFELDHCTDLVVYERMSQRLADIDLALAQSVAEMVGEQIPQKAGRENHGKTSMRLSQTELGPKEPTIETRRVAIIIADGYDAGAFNGIMAALKAAKAVPYVIRTRRGPIFAAGESKDSGKGVTPAHHLEGMRSTMFDSVFVPGGADSVATLRKNGRAIHWVREAFAHLKAIGAVGEAVDFLRCDAKIKPDSSTETIKMVKGPTDFIDAYTYAISQHRNYEREMQGFPRMVAY